MARGVARIDVMWFLNQNFSKQSIGAAVRGALRSAGLLAPVKGAFHRLASPMLEAHPPGRLREDAVQTLVATAEAFAGVAIDRGHYEAFFRWRAENLPGHRALYERFTATVNAAAKRSRGCDFATCENTARLEIIQPVFQARRAKGRLERLRMGVLQRDWVLFDRHIIRPIAVVFARTDAWRLVGYESWPATPRGLERYTNPRTASVKEEIQG